MRQSKSKNQQHKENWKNHLYEDIKQGTFNKQYFREEITREIRKYFGKNENENTFQNSEVLLKEINNSI